MLYLTKNNNLYKADKGILLYIKDNGEYVLRLAPFGNEMSFLNRKSFEMWLESPRCILYSPIRKAA